MELVGLGVLATAAQERGKTAGMVIGVGARWRMEVKVGGGATTGTDRGIATTGTVAATAGAVKWADV